MLIYTFTPHHTTCIKAFSKIRLINVLTTAVIHSVQIQSRGSWGRNNFNRLVLLSVQMEHLMFRNVLLLHSGSILYNICFSKTFAQHVLPARKKINNYLHEVGLVCGGGGLGVQTLQAGFTGSCCLVKAAEQLNGDFELQLFLATAFVHSFQQRETERWRMEK